jgi:hypothetical protein
LIERHDNVASERPLDLHRKFRRESMRAAIKMGLESHSFVVDLVQSRERKHLEAAAIGQNRSRPVHEAMEFTKSLDARVTGAKIKMIGVSKQDLRADPGELPSRHSLYGA